MALHASYLLVIPRKKMHVSAKHRALAEPNEYAREIIVVFYGGERPLGSSRQHAEK